MTETKTPRIPWTARRVLRWGAAILALWILGTYAVTRIASPWTAVRVIQYEGAPKPAPRSDGRTLRIACYNIAHGRGSGEGNWNGETPETRATRLDDIAQFLRNADLDVVVLNEVDFDSSWSGRVNQAAVLAARAGFPYRVEQRNFDIAVPFVSWKFGNAILSRHPISEAHAVDLPGDAAWETVLAGKKTGAVCTIELPDGAVRIFAVHLSYRSEPVRIESVRAIRAEEPRSPTPMIVAGDFNSTPVDFPDADPSGLSALDDLLSSGTWSTLPTQPPHATELTFSSTDPRIVIDWILAPKPWELLSRQVYPVEFSDHRPVIGILQRPSGTP